MNRREFSKILGFGAVYVGRTRANSALHIQQSLAIPSIIQTTTDWKTYSVKGEEFSVQLPVPPAMTTQTTYLDEIHKDRLERTLGAYADGVAFAIHSLENPKPKRSLEDLIVQFFQPASPGESHELNKDGVRGKAYAFARDDLRGSTYFYVTDRHFYVFQVVGTSLAEPEPQMTRFLDSVRFSNKLESHTVSDGLGSEQISGPPELNGSDIFSGKSVTRKAFIVTKPQPSYSEDARRNAISGTVVIRCVFSASGAVTNVQAVSPLPNGLTERAIYAARQIKFVPAVKDGRFVSMYMQLEYNFNLY